MTDLSQTIAPKSEQLNADDLIGRELTITITSVTANPSAPEQPVSIHYAEDPKHPWKPCKTMRRLLIMIWGPRGEEYVGRSLRLYRDPSVKWGGIEVGGIRIRAMSHLEKERTVALTVTRERKGAFTVKPLQPPPSGDFRQRALQAAQQGTVTFRGFWNRDDVKPLREALSKEIRDALVAECQTIAKAADEKGAPTEEDPFTGGAREREPGEDAEDGRAANVG